MSKYNLIEEKYYRVICILTIAFNDISITTLS